MVLDRQWCCSRGRFPAHEVLRPSVRDPFPSMYCDSVVEVVQCLLSRLSLRGHARIDVLCDPPAVLLPETNLAIVGVAVPSRTGHRISNCRMNCISIRHTALATGGDEATRHSHHSASRERGQRPPTTAQLSSSFSAIDASESFGFAGTS